MPESRQSYLSRITGWSLIVLSVGLGAFYLYSNRSAEPARTAPTNEPPIPTENHTELVPTVPATMALTSTPQQLVLSTTTTQPEADQISARAGYSISSSADARVWTPRLGAGWYLNWSTKPSHASDQIEFWPMVRLLDGIYRPTLSEISALAKNSPGQVWILGNEPDVIWQDKVVAEDYAQAYHELYQTIKNADPSAKIAVAGISQVTPLRLEYLDRVLKAYQETYHSPMPVDWWTVHVYSLREEHQSWGVEIPPGFDVEQGALYEISDHGRLDLFEAQLRNFRAWMQENGYQDTPLAVTEFGILMPEEYGFPPDFVADYLQSTFNILATARDPDNGYPPDDHRLVQRWAWFSLSDPNYPTSNLADLKQGLLTPVGEAFRSFVSAHSSP